jgi:DNA-directed RNA polymerase
LRKSFAVKNTVFDTFAQVWNSQESVNEYLDGTDRMRVPEYPVTGWMAGQMLLDFKASYIRVRQHANPPVTPSPFLCQYGELGDQ